MLSVKNLSKTYKTNKGIKVEALKNISLDLGDKGLIFVLGKSGSGKSTLLNILGGIDSATTGEIIVDGQSISDYSPKDCDMYRNNHVGFIFQEYNLIENYTVGDNINIALELQGKKADKRYVDEILVKTGLIDTNKKTLYERKINELSGGQKQRVAVARALIKNPKIILADEPTGALDRKTGEDLYELLKNISKDRLVIIVSHDKEAAKNYGDRIIEISDGEIISDEVKNTYEITNNINNLKNRKCCGLPIKRAFVLGAEGLRHNVLRLICSIFLSVITFIAFGFSIVSLTLDSTTAELTSLKSSDKSLFVLSSYNVETVKTGENSTFTYIHPFSDKQLDIISDYVKGDIIKINTSSIYSGEEGSRVLGIEQFLNLSTSECANKRYNNPYYYLSLTDLTNFVELNPQTGMQDANLSVDSRFINKEICRLPLSKEEIAITDLRADAFMEFGFKDEDGTISQISTPDDLIGKKLGQYTICGVFSTEIDRNYFELNKENVLKEDNNSFMRTYFYGASDSIITYGFVYNDSLIDNSISKVLVKSNGNISNTKKMIDSLTYEEYGQLFDTELISVYSRFVLDEVVMDYVTGVALGASIVLAVFAGLLLMNFLSVNISGRKKQLGILRALGARKKDVVNICLSESLIIACVDFVLSLTGVLILCFILNKLFFLSLFNVGILHIIALMLLSFGVSALATIIPVVKIASERPVDIIKNN